MVPVTQAFDAGIGIALFGHQGFEADFLSAYDRFALTNLIVQRLPAQGRQLGLELALFAFVFLIFLGGLRLTVQALKLTPQLFSQVGQTGEVFVGSTNTVFSLAAALLYLEMPAASSIKLRKSSGLDSISFEIMPCSMIE